jgi:putative endonuclease
LALEYLLTRGYVLKHRNFRFGRGEIDLVVESPEGDLVFVEVKSSRGDAAGDPLEWVTPRKRLQLQRVAQGYCLRFQPGDKPMRFDVVAVELAPAAEIRHIPHAFLPELSGYSR